MPCNKYWESYFADGNKDVLLAKGNNVQKQGWSLIDKYGYDIVPNGKYTSIEFFYNGMARVQKKAKNSEGRYVELNGLINRRGEEIVPIGNGPCSYGWYRDPELLKYYTEKYSAFI